MNIHTGLYHFRVSSQIEAVQRAANLIYGDAPASDSPLDFDVRLVFDSFIRRFIKPQVSFYSDQHSPFKPLPVSQAPAVLEWGMNWCIAAHEYSRLLIHSAVLVKNGKAIVFPALPGSGKSTLTAYLGLSGWHTYSDEMAIIDVKSCEVMPVFRPVCLKNNSIDLVKQWHPNAVVTPVCRDTQKGDVAHVKVLNWTEYQQLESVPIVAIVFPKYTANQPLKIYQLSMLDGFTAFSRNAFNYNVLGVDGFDAVSRIVRNCQHFEIYYDNVAEVDDFLTQDIIGGSHG